jgi:excisionase family DNA binding protein
MESAGQRTNLLNAAREGEELLTPQDVAKRLRVSARWVRDHATRRSPRIPAIDLGARLRFREADVEEFIRSQGQGRPSKKLARR